ncbi:MAG: LPS assembly lipoprotein LptE [Phycisphaerales bacterium]
MSTRIVYMVLTASTLMLLQSCASQGKGYTFGSNFDTSIRSIAIPIFANETFERGIELQFTESLNKQIRARTPWALVNSDRADTTLVGVITNTGLSEVSRAPRTGLVQEQAVRVTVRFEWRDNRTGEILVARSNFSATSTFVPQRGIAERYEHGQREAIEELATDLISQLRENW